MPWLRSSPGSPMPESISSCGELITPPARITSRAARAIRRSPSTTYSTPTRACALEDHARRQRVHRHDDVAARDGGTEEGIGTAPAAAVADRALQAAETLLLRAVVVRGERMTGSRAGFHVCVDQGIRVAGRARDERAVAAAVFARPALPRFLPAKVRQDVRVGPAAETARRPAVVVGAVPPHVGHGVDRGRAADHLAARALDRPAADARLGFGEVHPVVAPLLEDPAPAERDADPRVGGPAARLEHQDADAGVFAETVRQGAAGRPRAHDDVVELAPHPAATPPAPPSLRAGRACASRRSSARRLRTKRA